MDSQRDSKLKTKGFHRLPQQIAICCWLSMLLLLSACRSSVVPAEAFTAGKSQPTIQHSTRNKTPIPNNTIPSNAIPSNTIPNKNTPIIANSQHPQAFQSDVPLLTLAHLQLDYWLQKAADADRTLLNLTDIQRFNHDVINTLPDVIDVFAEPDLYPQAVVRKMITDLSHRSTHPRFSKNGIELTEQNWQAYEELLALVKLPAELPVSYALVTSRGSLRSYPTNAPVFSSATDQQLDRFQETAVFPGEALQVLHYSQDRQWAFVRHYHYNGWLEVGHFAVTSKLIAREFTEAKDFVLVTGAFATTNVTPEMPQVSAVRLEMGVKLPRVRQHEPVIHGQNASFSYVIKLPVRQPDGQLQLVNALLARNQDLAEQYLPLTKANMLRQAFKFLGERYGWGHDLNARDCSGFIGEVYRSFGFILPRNTSSQGLPTFGAALVLTDASRQQRQQALTQAQIGDLVFIPGHVMLVLGHDQGETFVIHDVAGLHYFRPDGSFYHSMLNGVSITPVSPMQRNQQQSYIDGIYLLKSLSREFYANPAN